MSIKSKLWSGISNNQFVQKTRLDKLFKETFKYNNITINYNGDISSSDVYDGQFIIKGEYFYNIGETIFNTEEYDKHNFTLYCGFVDNKLHGQYSFIDINERTNYCRIYYTLYNNGNIHSAEIIFSTKSKLLNQEYEHNLLNINIYQNNVKKYNLVYEFPEEYSDYSILINDYNELALESSFTDKLDFVNDLVNNRNPDFSILELTKIEQNIIFKYITVKNNLVLKERVYFNVPNNGKYWKYNGVYSTDPFVMIDNL